MLVRRNPIDGKLLAATAALLIAGIDVIADRAVRDYTFRWTGEEPQGTDA